MFEKVELNSERWFNLISLKNEIWKDIKEYKGLYQVSNYGRVKSLKRDTSHNIFGDRILKSTIDKYGYCQVNFYKSKKWATKKVHRLVAQAFIPNSNNYPCINHKDENKKNNRLDNLEFCTYKYNTNYGTCIERISRKQGKKVIQYDLNFNKIETYYSVRKASKENKISSGNITMVCNGKRKTAGGYIWKYDNN